MTNSVFRRDLTPAQLFALNFGTVGVLWIFSGDPMGQALSYGGPVVMTWGWLAVSALNVTTALCLAELAACMPAAIGSIYVFTARLAPWNIKQLMTWAAAWSNISGTLATTAAYAVAATTQLHSAVRLARITASSMPYDPADPSYGLTLAQQYGIYVAICLSWCAVTSAPLVVTSAAISLVALWQVVGGCALFVALVVLSPLRRSAAAIFTQYQSFPRVTGVYGVPFTVVQGLYFAVMTQNGYESVLYFVEEALVHRRKRWRHGQKAAGGRRWRPQQQQQQQQHQHQHQQQQLQHQGTQQSGYTASTPRGSKAGYLKQATGGSGVGKGGKAAGKEGREGVIAAVVGDAGVGGVEGEKEGHGGGGGGAGGGDGPRRGSAGGGEGQGALSLAQQWAARGWAMAVAGSGGGGWRSQSFVPESLYGGLVASQVMCLLCILLFLAAAPSLTWPLNTRNETLGDDPAAQVVYDIMRSVYGSGRGAPALVSIMAVGSYGSGLLSMAGAARKLWAMAVDGFIPPGLAAVNPTTRVPVRAAVLTALILAVPGLLMLAGLWVFGALLSFGPVAVNVAYLIPICLRLLPGEAGREYDASTRRVRGSGGFTLGRASRPLFWVSMLWLMTCIALTLVPRPLPWRAPTANWAPVTAVGVAAVVAASWWAPRWGAKRWFLGLASVGGVSYG